MAGRERGSLVQFVLNTKRAAKTVLLHGDAASEAFLSEDVGRPLAGRSREYG